MAILKRRGLLVKNQPYKNRKALAKREGNMAIKCNYCDGGQSNSQVGFNDVCSDEMIDYNVKNHVWCGQKDCGCYMYHEGEISRQELEMEYLRALQNENGVCYESALFRKWFASAGWYHNGDRAGEPKAIDKAKCGGLCVLSTRTPHDKEAGRFIFGLFLIDYFFKGDSKNEGRVKSRSDYRLIFSMEQARQLLFWRYYKNPKAEKPEICQWSFGLFHYLSDAQSVQILKDAVKVKAGTPDEALACDFLAHYCNLNNVNPDDVWEPDGALTVNR